MTLKHILWTGMGYIWEYEEFMKKFCSGCPHRCAYGEPTGGCFRLGAYHEIQGVLNEAAGKCVDILKASGVAEEGD